MSKQDWTIAAIAGAYQTGVLGVRSLMRRGVKAFCFDCNPSYPGFHSVYEKALLCPDPDSYPENWLHFMLNLAQQHGHKMALIPSSDKYVSAISQFADELNPFYNFSPGIKLQGLLADKQTQYDLAAKHQMPMPRTAFVHTLKEVVDFSNEASFPCLIKPTHFREWHKFHPKHPLFGAKIAIVENKKDLYQKYQLASVVNPSVILQEIIQGKDTDKRVYLSCYNARGQRIANAMFRELRCDPLQFGPASISEPVIDPETDEICNRFLQSIGYQGICEIEMKWDSRDGQVKLIEANPRLSGGGDAAPYTGVDLCWIHYLDLIGNNVEPVIPLGNDFRHVVLRADAGAVPAYMRAGLLTWRDILHSYRPPLAFFDLDKRDLRYSLETLYICFRKLLRYIFKNK